MITVQSIAQPSIVRIPPTDLAGATSLDRLMASTSALDTIAPPRTHTVKSGETLSGIAQRYGTDWQTLARTNGLTNPDSLTVGQSLRLPSSGGVGKPDKDKGVSSSTSGALDLSEAFPKGSDNEVDMSLISSSDFQVLQDAGRGAADIKGSIL